MNEWACGALDINSLYVGLAGEKRNVLVHGLVEDSVSQVVANLSANSFEWQRLSIHAPFEPDDVKAVRCFDRPRR